LDHHTRYHSRVNEKKVRAPLALLVFQIAQIKINTAIVQPVGGLEEPNIRAIQDGIMIRKHLIRARHLRDRFAS
jgi:hypothetical protein